MWHIHYPHTFSRGLSADFSSAFFFLLFLRSCNEHRSQEVKVIDKSIFKHDCSKNQGLTFLMSSTDLWGGGVSRCCQTNKQRGLQMKPIRRGPLTATCTVTQRRTERLLLPICKRLSDSASLQVQSN